MGWDGVLVIIYLTNSDFLGVMARQVHLPCQVCFVKSVREVVKGGWCEEEYEYIMSCPNPHAAIFLELQYIFFFGPLGWIIYLLLGHIRTQARISQLGRRRIMLESGIMRVCMLWQVVVLVIRRCIVQVGGRRRYVWWSGRFHIFTIVTGEVRRGGQ